MKKLTLLFLLFQGAFMMAQTKTVVTMYGEKVQINPNSLNTADNGLTAAAGNVQLGGSLLKPTTLVTTSSNYLALKGLEAGANADKILVVDASGILKLVDRSTFIQAGDNLGDHTATQALKMNRNDIVMSDRATANTNTFSIYKNNGVLGIYNSSVGGNDLTIEETTRKTGVNNLSIYRGTDASVPAAGSIAVSADASGNVIWKTATDVIKNNVMNIRRTSANDNLNESTDDVLLVDATSGSVTVTIPAGVAKGRIFTVKRVDNSINDVTIKFTSGTVDDTDTQISVGNKVTYQLITEGSNKWQTISRF